MKTPTAIATILAAIGMVSSVSATAIALNFAQNNNQAFTGGADIGPTLVLSGDKVNSTNWNSTIDRDSGNLPAGKIENLKDSTGAATTATVEWSSSNVYWNNDGTGSDEAKLAVGYLDDGSNGAGFTVTDIPYELYNVYVLFTSDSNGDYLHTPLTIDGVGYLGGDNFLAHGRVTDGTGWLLADGSVNGNYALVHNLSSTSLTVSSGVRSGAVRGPLTGVILEEVPEPSAPAFLAGLLGLGLLLRRRK